VDTPEQMLQRLEAMGEDRVRAHIGMRQFESKALPLVNGWLSRREKERSEASDNLDPAKADAERVLHNTRALVRQSSSAATRAAIRAEERARQSWRLALVALIVASAGTIVSVLSLFALAIR